jgi:sugar phosphate isomerase/epimerase
VRFARSLADRGLALSAVSAYGNPLHPEAAVAKRAHADFVACCRLAGELGVARVGVLAGCPGGGPDDVVPNWIVNSTSPQFAAAYEWQWAERVLPYWGEAAAVARENGVVIALEPEPATAVYNLSTFARLREELGPTIGMNFDPAHLWWQGVDPPAMVEAATNWIVSVHVVDAVLHPRRIAVDGVLSPLPYTAWDKRPWSFAAPGQGHDQAFWAELVRALRLAGFDGPLTIEAIDPALSREDALDWSLRMLRAVTPTGAALPPEDESHLLTGS